VVLGRGQPADHVDAGRAHRRGLAVVRRSSGGSAVLVAPGLQVWADVVVPDRDPLWHEDVGRAAWWLGEAWVAALTAVGVVGAYAHRGPMVRHKWSDRVCFASVGAGEVTVDARKVVGVAQRRTRGRTLFQCAALLTWEPEPLADVLGLGEDLSGVAVGLDELGVGAGAGAVEAAFLRALPD
jgi:lipoate-protein ligase A